MSQTNNLKLNKHDNPSTNENDFDIENYLNANWDKIDVKAGELDASMQESEENISTLQERVTTNEDNIDTLQTEVTELQEDVQNLRNASYKVSGSGTNFSLNNTTKNKFIEFLPGGNTEQTQLSGKNLLNKTEIISGYNVTVTQIENGVKLVGTYYAQIIQNVKKNTNYYLQYITNNIVGSTKLVRIYNGTSTSSGILKEFSNGNGGTFNSGDNEQLLILFYVGLGTSGEVDFLNIQLEEGTTATDYEPYCGGIPSPNPEYPQPIYNVTGNANVKIQNKNLAIPNDGSYNEYRCIEPIPVKTGDVLTYIVNFSSQYVTNMIPRIYADKEMTQLVKEYPTFAPDGDRISVLNITDNGYFTLAFGYSYQYVDFNKLFVAFGSYILADYVPHQEQNYPLTLGDIELCKIDEAKDYFVYKNNKWYKHEEVGKTILNGSESWNVSGNNYYVTISDKVSRTVLTKNKVLCSYFSETKGSSAANMSIGEFFEGYYSTGNKNIIFNYDNGAGGVAGFKTWLSTHNTEVYYEKEIPTDIEITDTTIIKQLEAIKKVMPYNDQTNISSESDEVGMIIDATAVGDINKVLSNLLSN